MPNGSIIMQLNLYLQETRQITRYQLDILDQVNQLFYKNGQLSPLEMNGALHALQILIENAIGKGKHWLKLNERPIPTSAYTVFQDLAQLKIISHESLDDWNAIIGLRNRIVHDYLNIDPDYILSILEQKKYLFVSDFLNQSFE